MKRKIILTQCLIALTIALTSCVGGTQNTTGIIESTLTNEVTENPFEQIDTMTLGSISHGVSKTQLTFDEENIKIPYVYNGGEIEIDYSVTAEGTAKNVGFLLYVDGVAQPYKISQNGDYNYMNIINLGEDNVAENIKFIFEPIVGNEGDTLKLTFLSIYNPSFKPDMVNTSNYGMYHSILPYEWSISYNQSVENTVFIDTMIDNAIMSKEFITQDFIDTKLSNSMFEISTETMENNVYNRIYFDDKEILSGNYELENDIVNVKYVLFGVEGAEYQTTFYLDHNAISEPYNTVLENGKLDIIDFELNTNLITENSTFYAISVPINDDLFTTKNVMIQKSSSILFYNSDLITTDITETNVVIDDMTEEFTVIGEIPSDTSNYTITSNETIDNNVISNVELTQLNIENIDGKVSQILNDDANKILILTDELYSYDVNSQKMNAMTNSNLIDSNYTNICKFDGGYAVFTSVNNNQDNASQSTGLVASNRSFYCYILDNDLKEITKVQIPVSYADVDKMAISPSGNELFYLSDMTNQIIKLNLSTKEETVVKDISNPDIGDLSAISYMSISNDGLNIVYSGLNLTTDGSVSSYGTISIDGSNTKNILTSGGYRVGGAVLTQNTLFLIEDGRDLNGRVLTVNTGTMEEKMISLSNKRETNGVIIPSTNGVYFATGEINTNELIVRIYNTNSGELISETSIQDAKEDYFYRGSKITISEQSRICTVALGNWNNDVDTKMYTWGF